jgi:VCBS repeat-containing protein
LRAVNAEDISSASETYQVSLMIMALSAAKDKADSLKIATLAQRLENGQYTTNNVGAWGYALRNGNTQMLGTGDPSNTQFAVLGLQAAVESGANVSRETWERVKDFWERSQNHDGGWGYWVGLLDERTGTSSRGSMTVAGIASLSIAQQMLKSDAGVAADGTPPCCEEPVADKHIQDAISWLGKSFRVDQNPGSGHGALPVVFLANVSLANTIGTAKEHRHCY